MPLQGETSGGAAGREILSTSRYMTRCFRTITTVFLLDPAAKLLQAGSVLREEDGWLLLAAAAVLLTLVASQGGIEPSWL